ncbi:MAG: myxococcus cysteine-rich repeat containing protein [Thermoanaerobaculia bacterium]
MASILSKASSKLAQFETGADNPNQKGRCFCIKGTSSNQLSPSATRAECQAQKCAGTRLWLPTDIFKDSKARNRFALRLVEKLLKLKSPIPGPGLVEKIRAALEALGSDLEDSQRYEAEIECAVNSQTEGYHLGAYSTQRPDLHWCVGYEGHGAYAQLAESSKFNLGARYTSHNLSATHRAQLRTGGFALTAFGRNLSLAPGLEVNLQVDGFKLFDACRPLGITALASGGPLCPQGPQPRLCYGGCPNISGGLDINKVDVFHLVDDSKLQPLDQNANYVLEPAEFVVATYRPFSYGQGAVWPRKVYPYSWEGASAAVFGLGLNFHPGFEPIEQRINPPIQLGPVQVQPVLRLSWGLGWLHEAYKLRSRLTRAINQNLPVAEQLKFADFDRPQHAFQAPDLTADDGLETFVKPEVELQATLGVRLSRRLFLGIGADLGTGISLKPSGYGGLFDLSRPLAAALENSNPPKDAPCSAKLVKKVTRVCSDTLVDRRPVGRGVAVAAWTDDSPGSDPASTYSCDVGDERGSCYITLQTKSRGAVPVCIGGGTGIDERTCRCSGDTAACVEQIKGYLPSWLAVQLEQTGQVLGIASSSWSATKSCRDCQQDGTCPTGLPPIDFTTLSECEQHGVCEVQGRASFYDVDRKSCRDSPFGGVFKPYQCIPKTDVKIADWEGPGCHPLNGGYASAVGCRQDSECAEGEFCNLEVGRCSTRNRLVPGSCSQAAPQACGPARNCVLGACVKRCVASDSCGRGQSCVSGVCLPANNIPYAEQVEAAVRDPTKPLHEIGTYALTDIELALYLKAALRIGLTLELFGKSWEFLLLDWNDAWNLLSAQKTRVQLGLSATYQDGCEPTVGQVVNHQPGAAPGLTCSGENNFVCRYPATGGAYPNGPFDQPHELLDWCRQKLGADIEDPVGPDVDSYGDGVTQLAHFGIEIGKEAWSNHPLCVDGVPFTEWLNQADLRLTSCRSLKPAGGAPEHFPCSELERYLLESWGCLNLGSHQAQSLATALKSQAGLDTVAPKFASSATTAQVLPWDALVEGDEVPVAPGGIKPAVWAALNPPTRSQLLSWLNQVQVCFSARHHTDSLCPCSSSSACQVDQGRTCLGGTCRTPALSEAVCPFITVEAPRPTPCCGDGRISCGEKCDDGNTNSGDGCSWDCQEEATGACCRPNGCLSIPDELSATECARSGGTPFFGSSCTELNGCGVVATGSCALSDGLCTSPSTVAECKAAKGRFYPGLSTCGQGVSLSEAQAGGGSP